MKLLVASLLALAACATESAPTPTTTSDGNEGVTLTTATPDRLTGSYVDASGLALTFDTARSGDTLYFDLSTKSGHQLIHAETTDTSYVFSYLDKRLTLEVDKTWVAEVQAGGDDSDAMKDTSQMHWTGDMAVLDEMVSMPEVRALPWL